jgi:hypothetical protein
LAEGYRLIASKLVPAGRERYELWYVVTGPAYPAGVICLSLIEKHGLMWGHKDMTEGEEPYFYSCPIEFLSLAVPADTSYGTGWREKVRNYAKAQAKKGVRAL